jgi:hypothetical protein
MLIKRLTEMINKNYNSINETMVALPAAVKQINDISSGIKTGLEKVGIAPSENGEQSGLVTFIQALGHIFKAFGAIFSKKSE